MLMTPLKHSQMLEVIPDSSKIDYFAPRPKKRKLDAVDETSALLLVEFLQHARKSSPPYKPYSPSSSEESYTAAMSHSDDEETSDDGGDFDEDDYHDSDDSCESSYSPPSNFPRTNSAAGALPPHGSPSKHYIPIAPRDSSGPGSSSSSSSSSSPSSGSSSGSSSGPLHSLRSSSSNGEVLGSLHFVEHPPAEAFQGKNFFFEVHGLWAAGIKPVFSVASNESPPENAKFKVDICSQRQSCGSGQGGRCCLVTMRILQNSQRGKQQFVVGVSLPGGQPIYSRPITVRAKKKR